MSWKSMLLANANKVLRDRRLSIQHLDQLTALADKHGSDKGTLSEAHGYTRVYNRLFETLRKSRIILLEIGLHRFEVDRRRSHTAEGEVGPAIARKAPSLEMWQSFFPQGKIFGFDVDDFSAVSIDRCTILRGDMASPHDLERLTTSIGEPIDIVIDDASHASHHQQIALAHIFPHVKPGGLYIIEDLGWQPPQLERDNAPKTRDVLRSLQVNGTFKSPFVQSDQRLAIEQTIESVQLFDSLSTLVRDPTDSLAVLRKRHL
jgi:hypothetical protein